MTAPSRTDSAPAFGAHVLLPIVLIAACLGVIGGLAEGGVCWVMSIVPDWHGWRNDYVPQILWIAPLANLLLFVAFALPTAIVSRLLPRLRPDLLGYALFGWLATYEPLAVWGKLHPLACVLLASGVSVQLFRFAGARAPLSCRFLGRAFVATTVLMAGLSIAGRASLSRAGTLVPPGVDRDQAGRPNVLLITLDTLRADHLSAYGYPRPTTPNIDRLAGQGVLFENAFATASWTLPSHATIMTGRYPHEHRADGAPLDRRFPTLAEVLTAHGYATAAFVANTYYVVPRSGLERGFQHFEAYFSSPTDMLRRAYYGKLALSGLPLLRYYDVPGRKRATEVNREFLHWVEVHRDAPFFAFLNYLDVHDPYVAPPPYDTRFSPRPNPGNRINSDMVPDLFKPIRYRKLTLSAEELQAEIDGYDASLVYLDAQVGDLLARLSELGLLDKTLLMLTSDHGESFGEHGLIGHGNSLYRDQIHVPLVIRSPGVPAGRRVHEVVSLQAIPATVMAMVGLDNGIRFPGTSLAASWEGQPVATPGDAGLALSESLPGVINHPAYPLGRRGEMRSLLTQDWHLVLHEEGTVELFRRGDDLTEVTDVSSTSDGKRMVSELRAQLMALLPPHDRKTFGDQPAQ